MKQIRFDLRYVGMSSVNRFSQIARSAMPVLALVAVGAMIISTRSIRAQDSKKSGDVNAGITISGQATAKEVGLPLYPGAKPHKDKDKDDSAANLGLWGGSFGFKLVVLKMESPDSAYKVAGFYQKALAKYGPVLDCSNPNAPKTGDDDKSGKITCGDDKADAGERLYKSGTKEKQHIVSIKTASGGTEFSLLYLEARGENHEAL
jgi:hypothetical protein